MRKLTEENLFRKNPSKNLKSLKKKLIRIFVQKKTRIVNQCIIRPFLKRVFLINSEYFWEWKKWDKLPPHKITNPASSKSSLGCLFRWQAPIRCPTALFCYKTRLLAGISRIFTQEHGLGSHNYKSHCKLIEDKPR